jgi:glycerol-3-phosphate cytidylyltransferase-like family protein
LKKERIADEVVIGDTAINSWSVIKKYKPTVVALGYDQDELRQNLEEYIESAYPDIETEEGWQTNPKKPKIVMLSPYKPETHHNKILRNTNP